MNYPIYYIYLLFYVINSSRCFYKDCILNDNVELKNLQIKQYKDSILLVGFNVIVVGYIGIWLFSMIYTPREFNLFYAIRDYFLSLLGGSFLFYWIHRAAHVNKVLFRFHVVHHKYSLPIGMRAAYTHPIDYFFGNMVPLGIIPFILGTDFYTICYIMWLSIENTIVNEHSNYNENYHHLAHHKYYNCNYGTIMYDKMFGTFKKK